MNTHSLTFTSPLWKYSGESALHFSLCRLMLRCAELRKLALALLEKSLAAMPAEIGETPKAILMISGHWEENDFAVMSSPAPGMVYDHGVFAPMQIMYSDANVPLFAALGAAENEIAMRTYYDQAVFENITASSYRFG